MPLTINGKEIERDQNGMFSHTVTLSPGKNTVTVINGDTTKTFTVTYKYVVIESYTPKKAQTYSSGSTFIVNVTARAGSKVTATFSGKTITLTKQDKQDEELKGDDTFSVFSGSFTLPKDKRTDTNMGVVKFKATYNGITEEYSSGKITVKKSSSIKDSDPAVTPQGGRYIDVGSGIVATIVNTSAETFNGNTTDDYSRPTNNYLPKGTMDYCAEGTIIDNNNEYVLLRCGRRVYLNTYVGKSYKRAVTKTAPGSLPDHNEITVSNVDTAERYTYIKLDCLWKAPFYFDILNQSYNSERYQDYAFDTVTYSYIDITFCYATVFTGTVEIPADHPLFASAEIIKNEYDYTLRLHLKKTGAFYGWDAFYDEDGKLTFKFLNPVKLENQDSLNGACIFIDVGHGGTDGGATGLSYANREAVCNLRLANKLKEKLEALGATVIMSRTDDSTVDPPDKQEMLRAADADYCIAIHHDSGTTQSGFGAYHFTPFSKTATDFIDVRMDNTDVFIRDWDVRFHYYFMARMTYCPVVLTENGFLTNAHDYNTTIEPTAIEQKAQALTDGVVDYFRSIQ
ncbi:MAG: N-acetylmuramoyl-L-alanine amidase [Ruminococcaceae bacterium]|nr:N-acetylmuramoyl-L-alanine amidase [Oscillospiraceae bacterium]